MDAAEVVRLFAKESPVKLEVKNTDHGEEDFRETLLVDFGSGKLVIKLASNGFTDEKHILLWERIADEYRNMGYYCPRFIRAADGSFPKVLYKGRECMAWGEEYSIYRSAAELIKDRYPETHLVKDGWYSFIEDAMRMDAKAASAHFDFTDLPSAYCMFELFDPNDETDETTEDAEKWHKLAQALPEEYSEQVGRIWDNWLEARKQLREIYPQLPTSVFQADLNDTNVLLDEDGNFKGIYDFNIGGKEVYINYLFRQAPYVSTWDHYRAFDEDNDHFLRSLIHALQIARKDYEFSEAEKEAASLLYRCIRPLWWKASYDLKGAGSDETRIRRHLEEIEYEQTRSIDFARHM